MWNLNPVATETLAPVRLFSKGPARNFLGPWLWRRHMIKRERESLIVASPSNTDPECFVTAALAYKHI